jgi:hypothetical protein
MRYLCNTSGPGGIGYISRIFPSGPLITIATKIHVTLNRFEIVFKFSSTLLHRLLFMYVFSKGKR